MSLAVHSVLADVCVRWSGLGDGFSCAVSRCHSNQQLMLCRTRQGSRDLLRHSLAGDAGQARICFCRQRAWGCVPALSLRLAGESPTLHQPPRGAGGRAVRKEACPFSPPRGPAAPSPHSFLSCREVTVQHRPRQPLLELRPWGALVLTASRRPSLASDLSGRKVNQMRSIRFRLWAPRGPAVAREGPSEGPAWWPAGGRRPEAARR